MALLTLKMEPFIQMAISLERVNIVRQIWYTFVKYLRFNSGKFRWSRLSVLKLLNFCYGFFLLTLYTLSNVGYINSTYNLSFLKMLRHQCYTINVTQNVKLNLYFIIITPLPSQKESVGSIIDNPSLFDPDVCVCNWGSFISWGQRTGS